MTSQGPKIENFTADLAKINFFFDTQSKIRHKNAKNVPYQAITTQSTLNRETENKNLGYYYLEYTKQRNREQELRLLLLRVH